VNSASVTIMRCPWGKLRELTKKVSLKLKGKVYVPYVMIAMVYGSETWATNAEEIRQFECTEMRMM